MSDLYLVEEFKHLVDRPYWWDGQRFVERESAVHHFRARLPETVEVVEYDCE